MTVDFPSSYPANATSANKPVDVRALQEAFAVALRNYGTERAGTASDTMLEIIRPGSHPDDDRNLRRRADRNDFTNVDRKLLDKSEIRSSDLNADYRERIDRSESLRNDHQARVERGELQQPIVQTDASRPTTSTTSTTSSPPDAVRPNEPMPNREHSPPQNNAPGTANTNSQPLSANAPNNVPNVVSANVLMPGRNVSVSMPAPVAPQAAPPQTFTLFTPTGRFGQTQSKEKENEENEEEESVEGKEPQKHQPFAVFEAIQTEAARQVKQHVSRQPKEPVAKQEIHRVTEKPREVEPDQSRHVKTLEEFLNTPAQNVTGHKKGEPQPPNQMQYINRIAAACEAAAHYAPIRIKLNLDHLGTLTLRFYHKSDKLTLRFETPTRESAQFIRDNLDGLWAILSEGNVKIASIEILSDV